MNLSRTLTNLEEEAKEGVMGEVNQVILREEKFHRNHI